MQSNETYSLKYFLLAKQDISEIVRYIGKELCNPATAENLAEKIITAIQSLTIFPYRCPVYQPPLKKKMRYEYRKLLVENYTVFYRIDEEKKIVRIMRVIYGRRDHSRLL
ncbi:MAG: type II toxin-antitoxin system RelE/ParE family toxin [Chitinispirillales bacterium]|jgi:plasmid stabilization system protein ParE|nr:type II toxin-antitoxin system RelE/ParE family toxin [Chitinispirillales bacterium]